MVCQWCQANFTIIFWG